MNYSVNLSSGQTVEVVIGEAAQINVEQALNYIESGRVEITKYVNEWAKPEITNYTNEYAKPIVAETVNQTTKPLIDYYVNTTTKPQIDKYVADNVKPYADSAQDSAAKAKISKDNAKTSETNAKASELAAASSAGNAVQSANDSKLWAVGTKTEKPEGSSKYWAEQAKNAVQTPDASETVKGIVRLATSKEAKAGLDDTAAITPKKLKDNYVSKSGDTMTGTLTNNGIFVSQFDSFNYIARSKSLVKGTTPTDSNKYVGYDWQDKNGQRLAYLGVAYGTNGNKRLELQKLDDNLSEFYISYPTRNTYSFYIQDKRHTLGNVNVNTWSDNQIQFQDSKATRLARIQPLLAADGTSRLCLAASKGIESESSLVIGSDGYTQCPKPADNSNSYAIATTNWAGGLKRENTWEAKNNFSVQPNVRVNGNARYQCICQGYTKGTAPATAQFGGISTTDKNGVEVATFYSIIETNNTVKSALWVKQPTTAGKESKEIAIYCDKNGSFHTSCGVQSNENNSIVTTDSHGTNYVRFGNGLQICWGSGTGVQVFPQPFKDTNYMIADSDLTYHKYEGMWTSDKTTTQFKINNSDNAQWIAIGYWY